MNTYFYSYFLSSFRNLFFFKNLFFFNFKKNVKNLNFYKCLNHLKQTPYIFSIINEKYFSTLFLKKKKSRSFLHIYKKNSFKNFFFLNNFYNFILKKTFVYLLLKKINFNFNLLSLSKYLFLLYKKTIGEGFFYIRGLVLIFFLDASFTDDEPLWEPIEWSLVQTWLLFIFIIAWIAENLITSRFGSYTGRDKRVWFSWYKTFWWIEVWYAVSYGAAAMFVVVPFYYELTYTVSFIFSWWNWCNRIFFFKFISIYSIIITLALIFQLSIKWLSWKKQFFMILIINFFLLYLLYTHFITTFFAYFTDPVWYQKTRVIDYVQLSHEPLKWGWGPSKRDHFTYHKTSTVFWFKNDGPFAEAFLMLNMFFFLSIFFTYIYWLILLRRIYTTKEITFTFATFCVSSLKQFFFFFFLMYILIIISFIVCYWRFPIEFFWIINNSSWFCHFLIILKDYFFFIISIFLI